MRFPVGWAIFGYLLLQAPSIHSQSAFEGVPANRAVAVPFRLENGFLIVVKGRIGTQDNLRFLLDTGATISVVDSRVAERFTLERRSRDSFNFDRRLRWEVATFPEVQLGPVRAASVPMLVGRLAEYSENARNVDAIIGMDLLRLSSFTIEFDARNIIFHSVTQTNSANGRKQPSDCPILEVQIQGRPVRLIVDTGFPGILLYEERLRSSVPRLRTIGRVQDVTLGGRLQARQAILPDVILGARNRDVPAFLVTAPSSDIRPEIDGVIGLTFLKARRVNFDSVRNTLSWE
jgi:predicted aspartyl protease